MGVGTAGLRRLWDDLVASRAGEASRRGWLRLVKGERLSAAPPEPAAPSRDFGLIVLPRPLPPANLLGPARHRGFPLPQFVTLVHGLRTVFSDAGSGPAVVFLHGPGGNLTHWLHVAPRFVDSCRVLGLDLPACGESERPRRPLSVGLCAGHVCGLLDELRIDRAAVVGHSLGAAVAAELARLRPDRVSRLVLLAPAGLPRPPLWLRAAGHALLHPAILGAVLPSLWRKVLDLAFAERNEYTCGFTACIEETCRPEDLADIAAAIAGLRDGLLDGSLAATLEDIAVPTLLAWGRDDPLVPGAALRVAAERRPDVEAREIPRCGRMPMIERPQETCELIRRHLRPLLETSPVEADLAARPSAPAMRPVVVASAVEARTPIAAVAASRPAEPKPVRLERGLRRSLL